LCTVDGLGHNWAGETTYGIEACGQRPEGRICKKWKDAVGALNQDLVANDMIWEFFKDHPME
jgi:poly(3-hydroxybutyrate) depolymerase